MQPAIRIENLSKLYRIGTRQHAHYRTLRETLMDAAAAPWRRIKEIRNHSRIAKQQLNGQAQQGHAHNGQAATGHAASSGQPASGVLPPVPLTAPPDSIWALNDVSFDVQHGEVVGIIGRNGAGKSTLLKVLSRITEPTKGRVVLNGRVASLLEVGTGFHPELTGRENIYLNGAILGMHRHEIKRKFDPIVDFSGVESFIDTPVKRYSSGMQVRLAFAVAAHLEPEILIVDEVLAVGDAEFQKKCLRKMQDVAHSGHTVLFVSHNLGTIRTFCKRGILLEQGILTDRGEIEGVVTRYMNRIADSDACCEAEYQRPSRAHIWMTRARLIAGDNSEGVLETGKSITIEVSFLADHPVAHPKLGFAFCSQEGVPLISANNRYQLMDGACSSRAGLIRCELGPIPLLGGRYSISLFLGDDQGDTHHVPSALTFDVRDADIWGTGRLPTKYGFCWWPTRFELLPALENTDGHAVN
jgi:lipopolysaccharide transport system ATP-binding protein